MMPPMPPGMPPMMPGSMYPPMYNPMGQMPFPSRPMGPTESSGS